MANVNYSLINEEHKNNAVDNNAVVFAISVVTDAVVDDLINFVTTTSRVDES